ncbi:MAG: RDD family protein [Gammaproteobacteria bacterium]|nr:RDD family protein [Gammaproteobacteria bacterium]
MPIDESRYEYVGFWARVGASLVDTLLLCVILYPVLTLIYGRAYWSDPDLIKGPVDFVVQLVLPAIAIVAFWIARQATPGKMLIHARIVDAETGEPPTRAQAIRRYVGYYVSLFGIGLGFFWVAWDRRKQGWHDKLAGTVVIRPRR